MQRDVSFYIHGARMHPVHFGNPLRQRFQMQPLDDEQFPRYGVDVFLIGCIDAVAPLPRLLIEIVPGGERTPGEEVVFEERKWAFHAC